MTNKPNRTKVFISAASKQFLECRNLLASDLRAIGCEVIVQEDFQQHPRTLLEKLQANVDGADRIVAIIGDAFGYAFKENPQQPILPNASPHRSYSQWEYFFALGERLDLEHRVWGTKQPAKDIFLYFASPTYLANNPVQQSSEEASLQQSFITGIKQSNQDRHQFDTADQLCRLVLRDGWQMHSRPPQKPILLPYHSIGTLFKGRERFLEDLRTSLKSAHAATAVTGKAVHGLGGVGKTRLAVEYAWKFADDYSAVLFLTADSPENLRRTLAELVGPMVLDLKEHAVTEEEVRVAAALRWLAEHPGWFLILDNVDTEEAAEYVEALLPKLQRGHVLITSRLSCWQRLVQPLELDVLEQNAAAEFLLQRTQPKGSRGRKATADDARDATALAKDLDGLALALEQAGAYIVARRKSLAEYIELWRGHDARVQQWHNLREMQYPRSVATTWQTTLDQLGDDERSLLNVLAWFDAEPVPTSVISASSVAQCLKGPEEDAENNENGVAWDEERLESAIANLADYSMLRWQAETVTVHRVVQEILRTRQDEPTRWLTAALGVLDRARPEGNPGDVRTWPSWETLRTHVEFATEAAVKLEIPKPTTRLMGVLGTLLSAKALHHDAEKFKRRALAIDEHHHGPDSTQVAMRLDNLAQTLMATNRLAEAEPLMRRALAIDEQSYGEQHPNVAIRLNNLASLLQATNRLADAEPLMRRALAIDEQSYGDQHPEVASDLNNLAQLLQETNRLAEAEPLMRRALAIDEQSYGDQHPEVAIDLNNLAQLLQATNRLADAEPLMRRALAIDEQSYGDQHPKVASCLNNLASLLQATNRLAEAEPLMRRVVDIFEKSLGVDHPNVATSLNNLASLLQATNRLAEAEPLMRRALAIDEQSYGDQHPKVSIRLNNLAVFLQSTNRLADAEPLMRRALAIDEQSYGDQHPKVAIRLNNLAMLLHATNRLAEAEPLMRRHVEIFVKFGKATKHEHPHMQAAWRNYRGLLDEIGLTEDEIDARLREVMGD